ncbi:putative drug efflux protein [Klebsiella grimontii]|uniref:Putative drug efflux protein n=1 Tax=Klebsiella grimontii TaxID=2058152 RepID=A0A7H4P0Z5_9ENTR|nr:putative drug efflux protein [Klebsiella grimontii]
MPLALWALAIGAFGIGTTEFIIAGLLPVIAADFNVAIPVAGYLATSYALGVFVGAPALIILGSKVPRKAMLVFLMLLVRGGKCGNGICSNAGYCHSGQDNYVHDAWCLLWHRFDYCRRYGCTV